MSDSNSKKPALFAASAGLIFLALAWPLLPQPAAPAPARSPVEVDGQSVGCVSCHGMTEAASMHPTGTVHIGCAFCHGGDASVMRAEGDGPYARAKTKAHPKAKVPELFRTAANAVRPYAKWLEESEDYIRFVNPGDLRVAEKTCGCHVQEVRNVSTSMMTHGGMLWGAALYNNGAFPLKDPHFGESYAADGSPRRIRSYPAPSADDTLKKGILAYLDPLARWEVSQPGNILRVFERGGGPRVEIGNPGAESEAGRPDDKLSDRGLGTNLRTDPVFIGLQKTRLLDPLLSQPGTNDHAGDYRQSGCTACHVIYANDRDPVHSGKYAEFGNQGRSAQSDPTIPKNESGHPIKHEFTRSIPTSQCIVCHIHPGTNMVASYLGYTWWDSETDGKFMYPAEQRKLTDDGRFRAWEQNPQGAAARGLWLDNEFLSKLGTAEFNKQLDNTQFADFHGHGWVYRAVYKRDRKGNLLDTDGKQVAPSDPKKFDKAVHLMDIHLEKGMHCTDCHFEQDAHGNGNIYGETRNAVEIDCVDCHGSIKQRAKLTTSAAAAPKGGTNLALLRTGTGQRRFYYENDKLYQRSSVEPGKQWEVVQVLDTITPGNEHYSEASRLAKTIQKDNTTWGSGQTPDSQLAHSNDRMTCYACHSSWTTSCFGCHLPMRANGKSAMLHNEGTETRNYTQYNFDVLRDDIYMLGVDGSVTGNRIAPTRSTCAVTVSSQNANRDWMYYRQQTISSEGFSGFGFSSYYPHTVRAKETKTCTSCHVSRDGDNNAWMAQILMQGTNLVNDMGRFVYVAEGSKGLEAVTVAERDDPPAIFGSDLHKLAYPEDYKKLVDKKHRELEEADHHAGNVLDLQLRGEYLYAALGKDGFRVYDVGNIENKNFSERITTAPASPLGQKFFVKTKNATAVASPSTLAVDPLRTRVPENQEQAIALMYGFLYVTDAEEGLIVIGDPDLKAKRPGVLTLLDGDPTNNFLKRATTFNPDGVLTGARRITIAGTYAYILTPRGLVVVDIANPLEPKVTGQIGAPDLVEPTGIAVQFRYAFVTDREGLKVLDTTNLATPKAVRGARLPLEDARNLYVARTYAYVAGGKQGLVIVDVEKPEQPRIEQTFNAGGEMHDTRDVKLGMTAASAFAYVADGAGGMKIVQLFAPSDNPNYLGFSPKPTPKLIATYHTHGPALAISKGIDRDRAVDESGNQIAVFNRRGSRPFNKQEAERMFLRSGNVYTVTDTPPGPARR
ncbi:MAG: hypothetical protein WDO18_05355 [Acidobacteriota bacterium]